MISDIHLYFPDSWNQYLEGLHCVPLYLLSTSELSESNSWNWGLALRRLSTVTFIWSFCERKIPVATVIYIYLLKEDTVVLSAHGMGGTCVMSRYSVASCTYVQFKICSSMVDELYHCVPYHTIELFELSSSVFWGRGDSFKWGTG